MRKNCIATALALIGTMIGCGASEGDLPAGFVTEDLSAATRAKVAQYFAQRQWSSAISTCQSALRTSPNDCEAQYCVLLGRTLVFVDSLNNYLLPRMRSGAAANLFDVFQLWIIDRQLADMAAAADATTARQCTYDLPLLPLRIGDAADPIVLGEVRGRHTVRGAYLLGAIANAVRYTLATLWSSPAVLQPPAGQTIPGLPDLLERTRARLASHDALLFSRPVVPNPSLPQGGWWDKDGDRQPSFGDELLIDIFKPGTDQRIYDFSGAQFVRREALPVGRLARPTTLQPARCGYLRWHIDTLLSGSGVGTTDGMSFLPDGRIAVPIVVNGRYQIHLLNADGSGQVCLTCTPNSGANDGVRWRPGSPDTFIFISNRDHPYATGGAGGGTGQELYAMRAGGTQVTRLTFSDAWATNYHVNWSKDGRKVVWGRNQERTWDVWIADFDDTDGFRLRNQQRLMPRDTTWWEPHGFTDGGDAVIATNSRAGLLAANIYAIDIQSGRLTRLTPDVTWDGLPWQTWNEHAHLSWDGNKLLWMSARVRPASALRLNDGALSPIFDFFWIAPGVFFEFINHPAGYASELYLRDPYADPTNLRQLTNDGLVVADSMWSPDDTRILFRQSDPKLFGGARIRMLTFDDCP